MEIRISDFP